MCLPMRTPSVARDKADRNAGERSGALTSVCLISGQAHENGTRPRIPRQKESSFDNINFIFESFDGVFCA